MPVEIRELHELPAELAERFDAGDGLIWTGAGVSRRAIEEREGKQVRVGLPSGWELQQHLHEWTRGPHPDPETLAEIAGLYVLQHGRSQLNRLIRVVYGAVRAAAPAFYDLIAALPPSVRLFVTTNYDPFLERALGYRDPVVVVRDVGLEAVRQLRPVIYKPHGDAQQPEGCVIATADYDAWEQSTGSLPAQLAALYLQHTVVAIGYRAQDDNFRRLLRAVNVNIARSGGTPHKMYVVIPDAEINNFSAYAGTEYDLLLVRATGEQFLTWLIEQLAENRRAREAQALSRLIDPPGVRDAQRDASLAYPARDSTRPAAADVPDPSWLPYAAALKRLSAEQTVAGRPVEALQSFAEAARAYRLGGDAAEADNLFRRVLEAAIVTHRDAELAARLRRTMQIRDRGVGQLPSPTDDETLTLLTITDIWEGIPAELPPFITGLEVRLLSGPAAGELAPISYRLERLRAEHAVTNSDFPRAAETYGRAANWASTDVERSTCEIRSALFRGLQQSLSETGSAVDQLRSLTPVDETEPLRLRGIGWLAALAGNLDEASAAFDRAAALGVEKLDPLAAAMAYRGAAWVERQRPTLSLGQLGPAHAAYRLEQAAGRTESRATVRRILEVADEDLRKEDWGGAWRTAMRARRLAFEDVDPEGLQRAERRVADAWLGMVPSVDDDFSLYWSAHFAALRRVDIKDEAAQAWSASLCSALKAVALRPVRTTILTHLARDPIGKRERCGFLLLLSDLAELIDDDLVVTEVVPAIITGLQGGWGLNAANDPARASCRLLQATYQRLSPEDAAQIVAELTALKRRTPLNRLDNLYLALAQAVSVAPTPSDGGASFAGELLGILDDIRRAPQPPHYLSALHLTLAAIADRGDEATRGKVLAALQREAASGEWSGLAVLAAREVPLPATLADQYLLAMTERVRELTEHASPDAFGPTIGDIGPLTQYAAKHARTEVRDAAISAAIGLLQHDGQWSARRAQWVNFTVRLLLEAPDRVTEALPCFFRLAKGEVAEPGDLTNLVSNHPLSAIRIDLGSGSSLRARALVALGTLWNQLPELSQREGREVLLASMDDPEIAVREGAVIGIAAAARCHSENWQQTALVRALRDPQERIRSLALEQLTPDAP